MAFGFCLLFFIAFIPVSVATGMRFYITLPLMLAFGGFGYLGACMKQKADSLASGIQGEAATASIVASLPESYRGFQNITVPFDGKSSEVDMVVVGPTGVFIIETKNRNGTVVGNYDSPLWTQKKIGQQGTPYSKSFQNPIKQVGTHVYRLANFLKSQGISVYVGSMVYFSNPETVIQLVGTPSRTPVFSALANGASDICNYILSGTQQLSLYHVEDIAALLEQL